MAAQEDISDPTDWLNTPVASLEPLEAGLRCEICKDFFVAPVLTACCHTFCSGCIRRSLSSVNASRKCPLCWSPFDEGQLRKNKVVEDLVKTFQNARSDILALGRAAKDGTLGAAAKGKKRKLNEVDNRDQYSNGPSPRKTRSQSHQQPKAISDTEESQDEDEMYQQREDQHDQADDGKVSCPICQQRMPEAQVFTHLDMHSDDKPTTSKATSILPNRAQTTMLSMKPLPTLSYKLLSDLQLRKRLRELGIPADGNKQVMSRRHTEWRNLVNANCDSSQPKSKSELLRELNQWERTQNLATHAQAVQQSKKAVMEKDFDRDSWSNGHNADFQALIAAARSKAKAKAAQSSESLAIESTQIASEPPVTLAHNGYPVEERELVKSSQIEAINPINPEDIQKARDLGIP